VRGRVLDFGAGTCWATARLSQVAAVSEVVALDMSEGFFERVGAPMIERHGGDAAKIRFAASTFEHVPFEDGFFDAVFMIAALHHSLAPLRALREAWRALRSGGTLVVVESPSSLLRLRRNRQRAIAESRATGTTEVAYTRGEIDYLLRHAGFEAPRFVASTQLSPNPLKRAARLALRRLGIEDLVLSAGYIVWAGAAPAGRD
jgi:ubiquinone/menaquinone biosynthesis C-methylase UbiE